MLESGFGRKKLAGPIELDIGTKKYSVFASTQWTTLSLNAEG
jgi:hypothetical protein